MKFMVMLFFFVTVVWSACAQANSEKAGYKAPLHLPDSRLAELATQEIEALGRDKKCDHTRPYVMHTPSQMGEALVGFGAGEIRDAEGFLKLYCVIEINAFTAKIGKLRVFPDEDGNTIHVHLDVDGTVTGFKTQKVPTTARTVPSPAPNAGEVR